MAAEEATVAAPTGGVHPFHAEGATIFTILPREESNHIFKVHNHRAITPHHTIALTTHEVPE